ncbi:lysophospholipid acyltransferase family protein [Parafrankia colletiae]|uniref:lysophospholipid acyltransferase family protein n=1 Tax=Parafrankia colletiae TaxID=573497 RepID=UPI001F522CB8
MKRAGRGNAAGGVDGADTEGGAARVNGAVSSRRANDSRVARGGKNKATARPAAAVTAEPPPRPAPELGPEFEFGAESGLGAADGGFEVEAEAEERAADPGDLERALAEILAFLRRRITGEYTVDEHGFDVDLTEHVVAPLLRPIYRSYFRVETRGLENIPDQGGALVVSNHSGAIPMDALMTAVAILDHHPAHRHLRMLAADLVFAVPFLAPLARKTGNTLACQADAERLLGAGHLVGVWPEGFKGIGKPFSERYKLQRFGRGGFVSAALRAGVPIVPCTVVGAEEIYPMIGNSRTLARVLGLPYLPITPTFPWLGLLGLVPLPSKWIIEFGEPVDTAGYTSAAADDPMLVFELTDRIRETIQHTLYGLLMQRRSVFF